MSTLARLVARIRDEQTRRLWAVLEGLLSTGQRYVLDQLLEVPPGSRVSDLERWRKGPPPRGSGPAIIKALDQVAEITALELAGLGAESLVPPRRLGELARYGMSADASQVRRHGDQRRSATLLATVRHLEAKSVDDTLELLDLFMATELVNKAVTASDKDKVRKHPKLARASARLAVAVNTLFASDAGHLLTRLLNEDLITDMWGDLLRVAASVKRGHATAALVVGKLCSSKRQQNALAAAIKEYGALRRTVYAARYLADETYSRRIGRQLNKGENLHALKRSLAYANEGALRRRYHEQQAEQMWCLTIATNAVVTWTTEYNGLAVTALRRTGLDIDDAVLAHIWPAHHENIHP